MAIGLKQNTVIEWEDVPCACLACPCSAGSATRKCYLTWCLHTSKLIGTFLIQTLCIIYHMMLRWLTFILIKVRRIFCSGIFITFVYFELLCFCKPIMVVKFIHTWWEEDINWRFNISAIFIFILLLFKTSYVSVISIMIKSVLRHFIISNGLVHQGPLP